MPRTKAPLRADGFTVETPRATTRIKSVGRWTDCVSVHSMPLKRLLAKLPATKELTLLYFDGWLSVGRVRLSATVVNGKDA
jgi:hypothetical protein